MSINEKLNDYIKQNGIKQIHIANETGISPDILSRILRGERKVMADEFLDICSVLKADPKIFSDKKTA